MVFQPAFEVGYKILAWLLFSLMTAVHSCCLGEHQSIPTLRGALSPMCGIGQLGKATFMGMVSSNRGEMSIANTSI